MDTYIKCPKCGEKTRAARYCEYCSALLVVDDRVCPQCSTLNKEGANFCKKCQAKLEHKDPFVGLKEEFDAFLNREFDSLSGHFNESFAEFLDYAVKMSEGVLSKVCQMKESVLASAKPTFSNQCISHIDDGLSDFKKKVWVLCEEKQAVHDAITTASSPIGRYELSPKSEWNDLTVSSDYLSSSVFIGNAESPFTVFDRTFSLKSRLYLDLLYKNNLIVRYNSNTEDLAVALVSTIAGRWLKGSGGKDFNIIEFDTQGFWGLGSAFNSLNEDVHQLINDEHTCIEELEKLIRYEQNVIKNRLSPQTPTALDFNHLHVDAIPVKLLIIRNFPQDVLSNLNVLQRVMKHSAKVGICVVLMADEDKLPVISNVRTPKEFNMELWTSEANVIDLVHNRYPNLPDGISLVPELLDETELSWIVDEVTEYLMENPSSLSVNIKDYLPSLDRPSNSRLNLSMMIGSDRVSFAPLVLRLNDMRVGNSLLVRGVEDSVPFIRDWMRALAVYALSCYTPDTLDIIFCDYSQNRDFAAFEGRLNNVRVINNPHAKTITSIEPKGRLLVFVSGVESVDEKELQSLLRASVTLPKCVHLIIEDVYGRLSDSWKGQQVVFGPIETRETAIKEDEFVFNHGVYRRVRTDDATIAEVISSVVQRYPSATATVEDKNKLQPENETDNNIVPEDPDSQIIEHKVVANDELDNSDQLQDGPLYLSRYLIPENKRWTYSSSDCLEIPIGINPWNDETVNLKISQKEGQNAAFVIGKSGTGKSSLLHTIILNAAYKYSPAMLHLYLVDLSGVEFQYYATCKLPHARLVAPQAEREFAMSVLDEVESEAKQRETLFSEVGQKDFSMVAGLPRILLIIDEFQTLFDFDDNISARAKGVIDRIVTKYRKYGINLLLATQRLPMSSRLDYGLINNRIVFDCRQDDFTTLFGATYRLPILGVGECMHTSTGRLDTSSHDNEVKSFYAAVDRISDDGTKEIEHLIANLSEIDSGVSYPPAKVFIRDREVVFSKDRIAAVVQEEFPDDVHLYLGESIAAGSDVNVTLDCLQYDNVMIMGGLPQVAQGIAINAVLSAADRYIDGAATCYILSFMRKKAELFGSAETFLCGVPFAPESREVPRTDFVSFIKTMHEEVEKRQQDFSGEYHHIYLLFLDYQNSGINRDAKADLEYVLKNGPQFGVFSVVQSAANPSSMRERGADSNFFNHRVVLQVPKEVSRDMIGDNRASMLNNLAEEKAPGLQRAYYFNRTNSFAVKFRPYSYRPLIITE